jgi:hypothetical protein
MNVSIIPKIKNFNGLQLKKSLNKTKIVSHTL